MAILPLVLLVACGGGGAQKTASRSVNASKSETSEFNAVSCTAKRSCIAVGFSSPNDLARSMHTLVEAQRRSSWSILASPNVAPWSGLFGVSCTRSTFCVAVGYSSPSPSSKASKTSLGYGQRAKTLTEIYCGKSWAIIPSPNPATSDRLFGVSCASRTFCVAVGQDLSGGLVETWNGKSWSTTPSPATPSGGDRSAVSCPSRSFCAAVGSPQLIEIYDGVNWSIVPSPNGLSGVSCTGPTSCVAVGSYYVSQAVGTEPLAETYNGKTWITSASEPTASGGQLDAVSCPTIRSCIAVGVNYSGTDGANLAETYNGTSWSIIPSAASPGSSQPGLAGVSCVSTTYCVAAGSHFGVNRVYLTSIETYNGSVWSALSSPNVLRDPSGR